MMPKLRSPNTPIAQRKRAIRHSTMKNNRIMTSVLVTALCNQPEACASEFSDSMQSRYLCWSGRTLGVMAEAEMSHGTAQIHVRRRC